MVYKGLEPDVHYIPFSIDKVQFSVILPADNKTNVEEDLTPEQLQGLTAHYVKTVDEVLEFALPSSPREERQDAEEREKVLKHITNSEISNAFQDLGLPYMRSVDFPGTAIVSGIIFDLRLSAPRISVAIDARQRNASPLPGAA